LVHFERGPLPKNGEAKPQHHSFQPKTAGSGKPKKSPTVWGKNRSPVRKSSDRKGDEVKKKNVFLSKLECIRSLLSNGRPEGSSGINGEELAGW